RRTFLTRVTFRDPATTETYTLSLHDALPICGAHARTRFGEQFRRPGERRRGVVRRAVGVGRPERQYLPPRLARSGEPVDEAVRLVAESAARKRRRVKQNPTGAFEPHQVRKSRAHASSA